MDPYALRVAWGVLHRKGGRYGTRKARLMQFFALLFVRSPIDLPPTLEHSELCVLGQNMSELKTPPRILDPIYPNLFLKKS